MSKFIDSLMTKSAAEAVEALALKYAEIQEAKRAGHVKASNVFGEMYDSAQKSLSEIPDEAKRALIGGAAGAGIGGLGSLGIGYMKNKKLKLSDALYGALAGAVPGAAIGALTAEAPVLPAGAGSGGEGGGGPDAPSDSMIAPTIAGAVGGAGAGGLAGRYTAKGIGGIVGGHTLPTSRAPAETQAALLKGDKLNSHEQGLVDAWKAPKNERLGFSKGPSRGRFTQLLTLLGSIGGSGLGGYGANQIGHATAGLPKAINKWIDKTNEAAPNP